MLTDEAKHVFNRMIFIRDKFSMETMSNSLLLLTLLSESDSEITNLLYSLCQPEDINKLYSMAIDMFANESHQTLGAVRDCVSDSKSKDIPNAIQEDKNGNIPVSTLKISENLSYTLMSAEGAKDALANTLYLDPNDIKIDTLMLFYGLVDLTNKIEEAKKIRKSIEAITSLNDAIIGEAIISKFNPAFKSVLIDKMLQQKNNPKDKDKDITNNVNIIKADSIDQVKDIINKIQGIGNDDDDDDYTADMSSNSNMVKVCNLVDPYQEVDLVYRDEYVEKIATLMSQCGNKMIAIVGQKGSGLTYFKHLLNEYLNQRGANKFQNLHNHKLYAFNTEYIKSELAKGNDALISLFYSIGKFLQSNGNGNGILFIDDLGGMFEVEKQGITEGAIMNICDWSSNETPTIVATMTPEQYADNIEKSNRLRPLFTKVEVPVMSDEDVLKCYNFVKKELDANHLCKLDKEELNTALRLAKKHYKTLAVPESLIKVADLAGAITLSRLQVPEEISDIERKYFEETTLDLHRKLDEAEAKGLGEKSIDAIYSDSEKIKFEDKYKLKKKVRKFRTEIRKQNIKITIDDIEQAITILTGTPSDKMNEDEIKKVALLSENLKKEVIGQDEAIEVVARTLKRRAVGLSANKSKTIGNLIFCGESGVGKTELAKQLAKYMFGDDKNMVRIDMSEFSERHTMSKLIGTSAGFVGYENDGILTKAVREKKYCVVLLDEMEKAAPEVFNLFLQVFDDGRLTTGQGELVDFSNTIIIMTSNVGARKTQEMGDGIGFSKSLTYKQDIFEKELRKTFQPEFLNRIDNIIVFNHLDNDSIERITELQLNRLVKTVSETGRNLQYTPEVVKFIVNEASKESNMGARPINRAIQNFIEVPLADLIVDNYERAITGIKVDVSDNKINLSEYLYEQEKKTPKKRTTRKKKEEKIEEK